MRVVLTEDTIKAGDVFEWNNQLYYAMVTPGFSRLLSIPDGKVQEISLDELKNENTSIRFNIPFDLFYWTDEYGVLPSRIKLSEEKLAEFLGNNINNIETLLETDANPLSDESDLFYRSSYKKEDCRLPYAFIDYMLHLNGQVSIMRILTDISSFGVKWGRKVERSPVGYMPKDSKKIMNELGFYSTYRIGPSDVDKDNILTSYSGGIEIRQTNEKNYSSAEEAITVGTSLMHGLFGNHSMHVAGSSKYEREVPDYEGSLTKPEPVKPHSGYILPINMRTIPTNDSRFVGKIISGGPGIVGIGTRPR